MLYSPFVDAVIVLVWPVGILSDFKKDTIF